MPGKFGGEQFSTKDRCWIALADLLESLVILVNSATAELKRKRMN